MILTLDNFYHDHMEWDEKLVSRIVVRPQQSPLCPRGPVYADNSQDSRIVSWHSKSKAAFDMACYFASNISVSGIGLLWRGNSLITANDLMPPYWKRIVFNNNLSKPEVDIKLPCRTIEEPCICAIAYGHDNYGHVLIEMLPRLMAALQLTRGNGIRTQVLLRSDCPEWLREILTEYVGVSEIAYFDPARERVLLKRGIFPTYAYLGAGFHPAASEFLDSIGNLPEHNNRREGHFFLSRTSMQKHPGRRFCENEQELVEIADKEFDVNIIYPENLNWYEQIKIFRNAKSVTGLYGSALHAAILADHNLMTGIIGVVNAVQTHIGGLRQQQMAYQINGFKLELSYKVPPDNFRRMMNGLVNS
jgi:hypothetical protein